MLKTKRICPLCGSPEYGGERIVPNHDGTHTRLVIYAMDERVTMVYVVEGRKKQLWCTECEKEIDL